MSYIYYKSKRIVLNTIGRLLNKDIVPRKLAGKTVLDVEASSSKIFEMLNCPTPCMICRIGTSEMGIINNYFDIKNHLKSGYSIEKKNVLNNNAGFFGAENEAAYDRFSELYIKSCMNADGVAILTRQEEYIIHKYMKSTYLFTLKGLEPYYSINPWTQVLDGKKILVIHPFAKSIELQYEKRHLLFSDERILPKFELKTLQAIQTIGGIHDSRFTNWFDALEYMIGEALKIEFDIAIIGCGAYGLPLASRLKDAGKKAIHLGGATQILFGIMGGRWDRHPVISKLYNEYWIRPSGDEIVASKEKVENGCYW